MASYARRNIQLILAVLGILISVYAYYVETTKEVDSSYSALCDINAHISCSKVFTSKWGRGLGLLEGFIGKHHVLNQPNSVFGILYYVLLITLEMIPNITSAKIEVGASLVSCASCVWLAYILFIVLQDVCIVCISMYIINFFLLVGSLIRYSDISARERSKKLK